MRKCAVSWGLNLCALFLAMAPVSAHHSNVMFDQNTEITLEGVVKEWQFTNPHAWLIIDVTSEDGTVKTWGATVSGRGRLLTYGIRQSTFLPGNRVSVTGHPMLDGRPALEGLSATSEDGTEFQL